MTGGFLLLDLCRFGGDSQIQLSRDGNWLSRVFHHSIGLWSRLDSIAVVVAHKYNPECAGIEHSSKLALPFTNRQFSPSIIPSDRNRRARALLVVVVIVLIFVNQKTSIRAGINAELDRISGLFRSIFDVRSHRHNRPRPHEQRHSIKRLPPPRLRCRHPIRGQSRSRTISLSADICGVTPRQAPSLDSPTMRAQT